MKNQIYKGIEVDDSVPLYTAKGEYSKKVVKSLDKILAVAEKKGHKITGKYYGSASNILVDFNCEHGINSVSVKGYKHSDVDCRKCLNDVQQGRENFMKAISKSGASIIEEYVNSTTRCKIQEASGEIKNVLPNSYSHYWLVAKPKRQEESKNKKGN